MTDDPDRKFVSDADPRRWGFLDETGAFVEVPKHPLLTAGHEPPVTFELYAGPRTIIAEPVCPMCLTACERCADPGAGHEPVGVEE